MIVLSPHLDDACWSCAGLLRPGVTVITICAGVPPAGTAPTQFDTRAGFTDGHQAMLARRQEDHQAAEQLGYDPIHLDCLDASYPGGPAIADAVQRLLKDAGRELIVGPIGLRHPDHVEVAEAFRTEAAARNLNAWVYEELPYAYVWPEDLAPAITRMACEERTITRLSPAGKGAAVDAYRSQTRGAHLDAILAPERYHPLNGTTGQL